MQAVIACMVPMFASVPATLGCKQHPRSEDLQETTGLLVGRRSFAAHVDQRTNWTTFQGGLQQKSGMLHGKVGPHTRSATTVRQVVPCINGKRIH